MSANLSPKQLAALRNLPLVARTVVDGLMMGVHQSRRKGAGMEFSQYRSYQPGDDLRQLDWKLFARSDRYYIREAEVENSVSVRFVLDGSASMNHADDGITKIDYARLVTACLAYLANQQGDATGLYVLAKGNVSALTARRDPQHLQRLLHQLTQLQPGGTFPEPEVAEMLLANAKGRELVIFMTDLHEQEAEITKLAAKFKAYRHEIIVFHLMAHNELTFNYQGNLTFEDWESGKTVEVATDQLREPYVAALQQQLSQTRQRMLEAGIAYYLFPTNQPVEQALRDFLVQRNRVMR